MANIIDYVQWRGDIPLSQVPFGGIDALILSYLSYMPFAGILNSSMQGGGTLLGDAAQALLNLNAQEHSKLAYSEKEDRQLLAALRESERFAGTQLIGYVDQYDRATQKQFSAVTFLLPDGTAFAAFRGTDDTVVGWKENFNMSFLSETPGQLKAVEYLEWIASQTRLPLRLMGHSKGGNLSVYAAIHTTKAIMERIEIIFSNDGPGFSASMIMQENYSHMLPKIHTIIPESSIVGLLLEHEEEYEVVESTGSGAGQHDIMSWSVLGTSLIHLRTVDGKAVLLDKTLKSWIGKMDAAEREEFVDALFSVLDEADIRTVDDLARITPAKFRELMKLSSAMDKERQDVIWDAIRKLFEEGGNAFKQKLFRK